tara:strand:+ start:164 stop:361 length:198 start_codon:yes stop_codon:yes gene_type:complete
MTFATHHPQLWKEVAHIPERASSGGKVDNSLFQPGDIAANLRSAPLLARIADNATQIGSVSAVRI